VHATGAAAVQHLAQHCDSSAQSEHYHAMPEANGLEGQKDSLEPPSDVHPQCCMYLWSFAYSLLGGYTAGWPEEFTVTVMRTGHPAVKQPRARCSFVTLAVGRCLGQFSCVLQ
jgi:hypothetical protein